MADLEFPMCQAGKRCKMFGWRKEQGCGESVCVNCRLKLIGEFKRGVLSFVLQTTINISAACTSTSTSTSLLAQQTQTQWTLSSKASTQQRKSPFTHSGH